MTIVPTTCVTNISGTRRHFGWIPPHGVTLEIGQTFPIVGILATFLGRKQNQTKFKSYIEDLDQLRVEVVTKGLTADGAPAASQNWLHSPVSDVPGLVAITGTGSEPYVDKQIILVEANGMYRFDAQSLAFPDGVDVVLPTDILIGDPGRWVQITESSSPGPGGTGTGPDFSQEEIVTGDNVLTTIATIPIADNSIFIITAYFSALRTDAPDHAGYIRRAVVHRSGGGGVTLEGTVDTTLTRESAGPYNVDVTPAGNDLLLQVKGQTGHTIDWKVDYFSVRQM